MRVKMHYLYLLDVVYQLYNLSFLNATYVLVAMYNHYQLSCQLDLLLNYIAFNGFCYDSKKGIHILFHKHILLLYIKAFFSLVINNMLYQNSSISIISYYYLYEIGMTCLYVFENTIIMLFNMIIGATYEIINPDKKSNFLMCNYLYNYIKNYMEVNRLELQVIHYSKLINNFSTKYIGIRMIRNHFLGSVKKIETDTGTECAICLEEIKDGYELNCTHKFHEKCLLDWCEESELCPLCKQVM